jgi:hypothetical protein
MIFHSQTFDDLMRSFLKILSTYTKALNQMKFEVKKAKQKILSETLGIENEKNQINRLVSNLYQMS